MSAMVVCDSCGEALRVPAGHKGRNIRCPECGEVCDVTRIEPVKKGAAAPKAKARKVEDEVEVEVDDENDVSPYEATVDPTEKKPCPKCREKLPPDAIICSGCGYNLETGEKLERLYKPVNRQWESGLPFRVRFGIFITALAMAVVATLIVGIALGEWLTYLISLFMGMALQAYVLGTYWRINLTRSRKGKLKLTRTWHLGFIPLNTTEINWRQYEGVSSRQADGADFWDLLIFLFLVCQGLVPAVLWYLFMMAPGQFEVALTRGHGYPALMLYHGPSLKQAKEMAAMIRDYGNLP